MNCKKARLWLLLADTGELAADRRARLDRHLAGCAECRRYSASLADLQGGYATESAASAIPPPTLDAIFTAARETAIERAPRPATVRLRWTWPERALAAAAALLAVLGISAVLLRRGSDPVQANLDAVLIERQVAAAVGVLEAEWSALDGELGLAALEIGDWLSASREAGDDGFQGSNGKGAGT